jgi:hypothetical protein
MNKLKIGWASRDISTDKPINIPGQFHMRISKGVRDPLLVNTLIIEDGKDLVVFLSADLVVIRSGLLDLVRAKTAALLPDFPVEKIIMNATHTHTGASHYADNTIWAATATGSSTPAPALIPHGGIEIASSDEYRDFLATQAAESIRDAYNTRSEGSIAYGYGYAVVGHSRRAVYFDDTALRDNKGADGFRVNGHAVMYGDTSEDMFSHYEAGADHFINLLYTFNAAGKLSGALINVPCPSQNSEHEWQLSADYWHDVRVAIQRRFGPIHLLSQCAASGDLAPRILHYRKAQARRFQLKYGDGTQNTHERKDIAERIAGAFAEVLDWAQKERFSELPIKHEVKTVNLQRRLISDDEFAFAQREYDKLKDRPFKTSGDTPQNMLVHNSQLEAQRNRFLRVIDRYATQNESPTLPMEMHVLRIGDIAFATNRFEMYMDYMHRIQARSPFAQTFVVQLTGVPGNDGGTYLATERGAAGKGYSACLFCNQVSPEGGQQLVEETVAILKKLHGEDGCECSK